MGSWWLVNAVTWVVYGLGGTRDPNEGSRSRRVVYAILDIWQVVDCSGRISHLHRRARSARSVLICVGTGATGSCVHETRHVDCR